MNLQELICVEDNIDLENYILCREEVKKHMEHPEWLGDFSKQELIDLLNTTAKLWLYFKEEEIVCSMMVLKAIQKDIDKFGVTVSPEEAIDYGPMFVSPKYQGHGLQLQMLKELESFAKQKKIKFAITTVHPENQYSIKNIEKNGFKKVGKKILKRGERNIYLKRF